MSNQSSTRQNAVRAASTAANIAKGAAAGGVYGAAFEAAKSFLPELIRLFVILLFVVILIPMLVFTALPNILFGYSSSTDQKIIDFTSSAQELRSLYQGLDDYDQPLLPTSCEQYPSKFLVRWETRCTTIIASIRSSETPTGIGSWLSARFGINRISI